MKSEVTEGLSSRARKLISTEWGMVKVESGVQPAKAMGVFEAVSTNNAVREFRDEPIREEHLLQILRAAQYCQSAKNLQPWHFIVIRSRTLLDKIADEMKDDIDEEIVRNAPAALAIISDPSNEFHLVDAARAAQNITLTAWELGVGTCWISGLEPPHRQTCRNRVKQILLVPASLNLVDLMVLGYPKSVRIIRWKNRKKLHEITSKDSFGAVLAQET